MTPDKELVVQTNYISTPEYQTPKQFYPLDCNTEEQNMEIVDALVDKMVKHNRPISFLLTHRKQYYLTDFPSYAQFITLLNRMENDFPDQLAKIEHDILCGEMFDGVMGGVENENTIQIKGNQIAHGMLLSNRKMKSDKKKVAEGAGIDLLKMLDKVDTGLLANLREELGG